MKDRFVTYTVLLILMVVSILPGFAQTSSIDITGNLVNNTQTATTTTSTWQNAVFQNSLTCWAAGDPGYCGPMPIVRPNGDVNFSYGLADLHQRVNVGKALPYGGSGLVVTGFNFNWTSKNGNGWDDGRLDVLSAYVKLYNSGDSKVIESFNYNLNFVHNWTNYNWNANWVNTKIGYRGNQVGNVQFGFMGSDNNYWAGPYGPEVTNISFQLKYKPDPCKNNPLFSPECPNFQDELKKNNAPPTTEIVKIPTSDGPEPKPMDGPREKKEVEEPMGFEKDDRYEEGYNENIESKLEYALLTIQDNQIREEKITLQASENAIKETEKTAQQTVRQAEKIAEKLSLESVHNNTQSVIVQEKDNRSIAAISLLQAPSISAEGFKLPGSVQHSFSLSLQSQNNQQQNTMAIQTEQTFKPFIAQGIISLSSSSQQSEATVNHQDNMLVNEKLQTSVNSSTTTISSIMMLTNPLSIQIPEIPATTNNFLTNKTNPVNFTIDSKPQKSDSEKTSAQTQQVKSNVQDNEIAGGVSIGNIARSPIGFNSYMVTLNDANFYKPKEIYRNQKTVDNVRVLRQLASDRLHQEMVDQQYRR